MSKVVFEWVEREECDQRHSFLGSLGGIVVKEQDNGHKYILSLVCVRALLVTIADFGLVIISCYVAW